MRGENKPTTPHSTEEIKFRNGIFVNDKIPVINDCNEATECVLRIAQAFHGQATPTAKTLTTTEISHEPVVFSDVITTTTIFNCDKNYLKEDNSNHKFD